MAAVQHQQLALPCTRPRTQPVAVGACTGATERIQALVRTQCGALALAVVGQPVADQQVLVDIGLRGPIAQRTGTVVGQGLQVAAQRAPVAVADRETTGRLGAIAQHGQLYLAIADGGEVALKQGQFRSRVAMAGRAGRIPQQADAMRQGAVAGLHRHRHLHHHIVVAIEVTPHRIQPARQRQGPAQLIRQLPAAALPLGAPGAVAQGQGQRRRSVRHRYAGGDRVQLQLHRVGLAHELQRQRPAQALPVHRQGLTHGQRDPARAQRWNGVDAQAELVAGGLLQQARVNPAPLDCLEHLPSLRLGHGHRIAQHAVDIQRERGHLLALGQREFQRPLQHAPVRVAEHQFDAGLGQTGRHMAVDARLLQLHRLFRTGHLQQRLDHALRCRRRHTRSPAHPQQQPQANTAQHAVHVTLLIR